MPVFREPVKGFYRINPWSAETLWPKEEELEKEKPDFGKIDLTRILGEKGKGKGKEEERARMAIPYFIDNVFNTQKNKINGEKGKPPLRPKPEGPYTGAGYDMPYWDMETLSDAYRMLYRDASRISNIYTMPVEKIRRISKNPEALAYQKGRDIFLGEELRLCDRYSALAHEMTAIKEWNHDEPVILRKGRKREAEYLVMAEAMRN